MTYDDANPWDEFKDPAVTRWKMARAAIEHENTLKNHRISWLILSQAFLFAAFAAVFNEGLKKSELFNSTRMLGFMGAVCIIGIFICGVIAISIGTANKQIDAIVDWHQAYGGMRPRPVEECIGVPPVNGSYPGAFHYLFSERGLPFGIIFLWIFFLVIPLAKLWQLTKSLWQASFTFTVPLGVLILLVVLLALVLWGFGTRLLSTPEAGA